MAFQSLDSFIINAILLFANRPQVISDWKTHLAVCFKLFFPTFPLLTSSPPKPHSMAKSCCSYLLNHAGVYSLLCHAPGTIINWMFNCKHLYSAWIISFHPHFTTERLSGMPQLVWRSNTLTADLCGPTSPFSSLPSWHSHLPSRLQPHQPPSNLLHYLQSQGLRMCSSLSWKLFWHFLSIISSRGDYFCMYWNTMF